MKKISHILISISLLISFVACEKVLEVEPTESISTDQAIQNKNDVLRALYGCYDALQQAGLYGLDMVVIPDLAADNLEHSGTRQEYGQIDNNSILAENFLVEGIWNDSYDAINRVNTLLDRLPEVGDLTETERNDITGQLYFIRALMHFNLVSLFGPVPVKTSPTYRVDESLDVGRNATEEVYNRILIDLENAYGSITNMDQILASKGAARALMARVYLYSGDWENAKKHAGFVIDSLDYFLDQEYNSLFTGDPSPEIIFQVDFNTQDQNSLAYYFFPTSEEGRNEFTPTESIEESYDPSDHREVVSIAAQGYVFKYRDITTGSDNVIILRLAEMYLIRAEAEARLNGNTNAIKSDINMVRFRAGLGETDAVTYGELLLAIEQERRIEFAFEGHRWFDLVRTGRAIELLESVSSPNQLLFPVPLSEITTNTNPGMYQNPGY